MLKLIMFVIVNLGLVGAANAMPSVGDQAVLTGTYSQGGHSLPASFTTELISRTADTFLQRHTTSVGEGDPQVVEQNVPASSLLTDEQIADAHFCSDNKGEEYEITVAAGTYKVCMVEQRDKEFYYTYWIGRAPLGMVKLFVQSKVNFATWNLELSSFKYGPR